MIREWWMSLESSWVTGICLSPVLSTRCVGVLWQLMTATIVVLSSAVTEEKELQGDSRRQRLQVKVGCPLPGVILVINIRRLCFRLVSGAGDIKITKDGNILLHEMVSGPETYRFILGYFFFLFMYFYTMHTASLHHLSWYCRIKIFWDQHI